MANPGGVGTKFLSVNLNKSYGPVSHHQQPHGSGSYGQAAATRARPSSHGSGGGGGMVVLSRPRSSQKVGSKLSVPPPLNLPSLRKEHERFDVSGSGGGSAGGGVSGSGSRPASSGLGWTRPGAVALQEKDGNVAVLGRSGGEAQSVDGVNQSVDAVNKGSAAYMPPSVRLGGVGLPNSVQAPSVERASVLRGEDFPSLRAALPSSASGPVQKQKDGSHQKQKNLAGEESSNEQTDSSLVHMRPQGQSSHPSFGNGSNKNCGDSHGLGSSQMAEQGRKQEYFPGPLPLVMLNPRSDWADDERDTGRGFAERGRDHVFPKNEAYWDREFDMPRNSVLPHKPAHNLFERRGKLEDETLKVSSIEVPKVGPYHRDVRTPNREGNMWRTSPLPKAGLNAQEVAIGRNGIDVRPMALNREVVKENKYIPPHFGDNSRDGVTGNREAAFGRRDVGHGHEGRHQWNHMGESYISRGIERDTRDRYVSEQSNRYRGDVLQDSSASKSPFSSGGKGFHINDPTMNFSREKRSFSKSERPYLDDPFLKEVGTPSFDECDPFPGGLVGVIKRKKDVVKQADFHDPVRESFEAELERVQKMQEQERQRIIEEQERALEQARREEEERQRLIREEEEQRRRLEEEAREAAWRAEQERLEAFRRAEEQKIAREEEKQRILLEEERRKQAAKEKLLELEAKIAKRQIEAPKGDSSAGIVDDKVSAVVTERDVSRAVDLDNWEDSERMVERLTTSGSSDSSALNRPFDLGPRFQPTRECSYGFLDKGKPANSWRRDVFEDVNSSPFLVQNQDSDHHSPRRDVSVGGRAVTRKELHGGGSYMSSRTHVRGGMQEHHMEDFTRLKGQRWSGTGDGDSFSRNTEIDPEFHENVTERYGDVARGLGHTRCNPRSPYPDRLNFEADELYSYGRSRYSMRQPRVLPPPSIASVHKTSFRGDNEHPGPSTFLDNNKRHSHASRSEPIMQNVYYSGQHEESETTEVVDVQPENTLPQDQKLEKITPRCASQSSLSVSSPPNSPTPLSHDDLDESGDSPVASVVTEGKDTPFSGNESVVLNGISGKDAVVTASSFISGADDEDWALENNEELQEQEEYDEDEDGYQEEDEVHEGDDEPLDLTQEFDDLDLEERGSRMMDNLVLGFDEGVEVGIPSDEFERSPRNLESSFGIPEASVGIIEEQGPVDGMQGDGHRLQPLDSSPQMCIDSSSRVIQETEKAIQDSVAQPINTAAHTSPASDQLDSVDASNSSGVCAQLAVPSSVNMALHSSSQTVMSTLPVAPSQPDLPVKLQFGLFSGPSLIPSPVPAIQIGSIQMPLHLHPPVGSSLPHIRPPQPPLFQFGQLRYTSPISQGILPVAPQSVSFIQSNVLAHYNLNQSSGGPLPIQPCQDSSTHNLISDDVPSVSMDRECTESNALIQNRAETSHVGQNKDLSQRGSHAEDKRNQDTVVKDYILHQMGQYQKVTCKLHPYHPSIRTEKDFRVLKVEGPQYSNRGKKIAYPARNPGLRSSFLTSEASRSDSRGFQRRPRRTIQRTEFRVRENVDWQQSPGLGSSNNLRQDDKSNFPGREVGYFVKSVSKKGLVVQKPLKQIVQHERSSSDQVSYQGTDSGTRLDKRIEKEASTKTRSVTRSGEANLTRNICSEEDVDAPLQSGIVRVFNQPGIEAASDGDDFIEVRSKRQMLNDRREQREKEIKAKSRITKGPRKPRSLAQDAVISTSSNKTPASLGGEAPNKIHSIIEAPEGRVLVNRDVSTGFATMVSQPLAPIGTPVAANSDAQADKRPHNIKSLQKAPSSVISNGGKKLGPGLMFETKSKILDNVPTSLGSWDNAQINHQVMALTQTQLDEAMKPGRFDTYVASIGDHTSSVTESIMPSASASILAKDKAFSSATSPINSLLAGEKIQFGAVTSPTVLPPGSCTVSHGMGAPGSSRSDIQLSHNLSGAERECTLFFGKDEHQNESCVHLEDCEAEAEAEAAASAVAVAAIGSDEIVGNGLGTCSVSVSDSKSFAGTDIEGISGGVTGDQQLATQSRADESLSVALPADLSVDTPAISLWPPLPSPQNSSSQMLSHFPGGPPSHFPFYEMNPMLGGPIFAFGPHDESASNQSQSQKTTSASGPLGNWQQCHSGVDSFYGPPAGFSGPFISPPGGIPGVQGPPHMVVYNHFPVGQFGQVGLSFMGTTYFPSGKQPDWKHHPTSSAMGTGEGDMNNINMVSAQRNPLNMASPVQHLSPGSPLLPMVSPFAMLDVSPFQSAPDMSVQGRWSHVPASPLHSVPLSLPLQQPEAGVLPSQFSHGHLVDQSLTANRFSESRTSTPSDSSRSFPVATDSTVTQFPDELGLVDSSSSTGAGASAQGAVKKSFSGSTFADVGKTDTVQNVSSNNGNGQNRNAFKNQSAQQFSHSTGYNYQRGGVSQKNSTGSEWSHRRMGFHGRNHSPGAEKSYNPSKVKQIYVAKQNTSGNSTVG
ncbi:LOW QUALITY PROTEIN: uncharacterized protein LOC130785214 [Actinidia eriantha]|uniref:LOW QUALITY PROTEIN: uncharacterized protein LOC130785214 n=1 Tax=Actinidia eriantha TaxID=165200 RepID=UPI00258F036F|nr:LOW QUALITY PROTEIN: uncharacterized protein LOC130785214 [Actinidia eriantha]